MKIRTDFVTNSSSSSFIIGKHDEDITVDTVFNMLKGLYQEYLDKRDALKVDCDKFGIVWVEGDGFQFKEGKPWDKKNEQINKQIERIYGINTWDAFHWPTEWMSCETYKDYEKYWLRKYNEEKEAKEKGEKVRGNYAPFSIADFSKPADFYALEDGSYCLEGKKSTKASQSDIFGWYIGCSDALFGDAFYEKIDGNYYDRDGQVVVPKCEEHCSWCSYNEDSKNATFKCDEIIKKSNNGEITDENAIAMVLGKICIMSECGWIPDRIVDKLGEISRFFCNHMG